MNNRSVILTAIALILAALYVTCFTDWFKKKQIQISFRTFPGRAAKADVEPIVFLLDKEYNLTSVRVIPAAEAVAKKRDPHTLWQIVPETNAAPVTDFPYGGQVKGMKPSVAKAVAEKLQPETRYRIIVDAGKLHGEREFTATAAVHPPSAQSP